MLATLDIADDVLARVEDVARRQGVSVGAALSEAARRGLTSTAPESAEAAGVDIGTKIVDGFVVFDVPAGGTTFGSEDVARWLEEAEMEDYLASFPE